MNKQLNDLSSSQGWGADKEMKNRPGVPKEGNSEKDGITRQELVQQVPKVKIYKTIERPQITPVFGTACPPRGLSGKIRDVAYKYSENALRHWMLLLFADRVDMVEGIIEDLTQGRVPNPLREMGILGEKDNIQGMGRLSQSRQRGGPPTKGLIYAGVFVGLGILLWSQSRRRVIA